MLEERIFRALLPSLQPDVIIRYGTKARGNRAIDEMRNDDVDSRGTVDLVAASQQVHRLTRYCLASQQML